ncbi:unnamed protein product [Pedinophyceae sp. YPF-701]|nr:unnamed protein product [Pedinophyceae sp. YPF-701]
MAPGASMLAPAGPSAAPAFLKGSIIKVELRDFMTFRGPVTFRCNPRLNLIVGPNGTGKSSLVCAICVGLGGSPKLLNRADNVSEFIRRGAKTAIVRITLQGDRGRTVEVERELLSGNSSKWRIDRKNATMKAVHDLCADHGIQLDNLCQFLPQDKVAAFSNLTPRELLLQTERALGDSHLYDLHQKLITLRKEEQQVSGQLVLYGKRLAEKEQQLEALERARELVEQRERLRAEAALLDSRVRWVQYEAAHGELAQDEAAFAEVKASLDAKKKQVRDMQKEKGVAAAEKESKAVEAQIRALREPSAAGSAARKIEAAADKIGTAAEDFRSARMELAALEDESARHREKLEHAQREIAALEREIADLETKRPEGPSEEEARRLGQRKRDLTTKDQSVRWDMKGATRAEHEARRAADRAAKELAAFADPRTQRVHLLAKQIGNPRARAQLFEAYAWVREGVEAGRFKGRVYGPVFAHVSMRPDRHVETYAHVVSSQVARDTWNYFVVECDEDRRALLHEMPRECNWGSRDKVNIGLVHPKDQEVRPLLSEEEQRRLKVPRVLSDAFDAPPAVKALLCNFHMLHKIYVFPEVDDLSADHRNAVWQAEKQHSNHGGMGFLYTRSLKFSATSSRYDGAVTQQSGSYEKRGHMLLQVENGAGGDRRELETRARATAAEHQAAQAALAALEGECDAIAEELGQLREQEGESRNKLNAWTLARKKKVSMLDTARKTLARHRGTKDPLERRAEIEKKIERAERYLANTVKESRKAIDGCTEAPQRLTLLHVKRVLLRTRMQRLTEERRALEAEIRSYEETLRGIEGDLKRKRESVAAVKASAVQSCGGVDVTADTPAARELREKLEALGSDEDQLETRAEELRVQAARIIAEHGAEEQLRRAEAAAASLRQDIDEKTAKRDTLRADIAATRDQWLPPLREKIARISEKMSESFSRIAIAGEVALIERTVPDNADAAQEVESFEDFAVEIRVRFRENQDLQALRTGRQSGGEHSVSTIAYLTSLQGVTFTPFRVVDEINQGMDPVNERKVYHQLVEAASREGTPQCFLLTPKLLPGLPYNEHVEVHTIHNGPKVAEVWRTWDLGRAMGRKRTAAEAGLGDEDIVVE